MLHILITLAVILSALDHTVPGEWWEPVSQRMLIKAGHDHLGQFLDTRLVVRVPDVDDLAAAAAIGVVDHAE